MFFFYLPPSFCSPILIHSPVYGGVDVVNKISGGDLNVLSCTRSQCLYKLSATARLSLLGLKSRQKANPPHWRMFVCHIRTEIMCLVSFVLCPLIFLHVSVCFPSCLLPCSLSLSGPTASHRALLPPRPQPRVPCPIPICQQVHTHKHFINCIIIFGYNCFNTVLVCVYLFIYYTDGFCFSVLVLFMMTLCQWLTGTFE